MTGLHNKSIGFACTRLSENILTVRETALCTIA